MDNGLDYRVTERAREMIAIFLKPSHIVKRREVDAHYSYMAMMKNKTQKPRCNFFLLSFCCDIYT